MHRAPVGKVGGPRLPLAVCAQQVQHRAPRLMQVNGARLGLLARTLQQGLDDLELLTARVAGVLLGSLQSIVTEQLKIVNTF